MKAFEEWLYNNDPNYGISDSGLDVQSAKQGWCAALEWALTQTTKVIEKDGTISNSDNIFSSDIRQELEQ